MLSEIQQKNREIIGCKGTYVVDIYNANDTFDGEASVEANSSFESPDGLYLNDKPVPEEYYEAMRENIRNAKVSKEMPVQYGVCVNRTVMKGYPYSDLLTDDPKDPEWDDLAATSIYVNEPLIIYYATADGKFYLTNCSCCGGWVPSEDVAICKDKEEWRKATDFDNVLVVTGEKITTEASLDKDVSEKVLCMGTKLEYVTDAPERVTYRAPWDNYVVKMPVRQEDGTFAQKLALIPANRDVSIGYLPYTTEQVLTQCFKELGNRYGWGGMLNSQDCSGYAREIYRCFGFDFARNGNWQEAMPMHIIPLEGKSQEEKEAVLDQLLPGSLLRFPGHVMIYLGESDGRYYTINDLGSMKDPDYPDNGTIRVRSVVVNDLSSLRANNTSWMDNLTYAIEIK